MEERVEFDLNQEPWELHRDDSVLGLGSLLNDIGAVHGRIEERIQQLEALTSRAMQRRRRQQGQPPIQPVIEDDIGGVLIEAPVIGGVLIEAPVIGGVLIEAPVSNEVNMNVASEDNTRRGKRGNGYLIAKALEMEMEIDKKRIGNDSGGFFDCNICLDIPRDPILTCCGHMFCWPCFYRLPYDQSDVRECPVCMGEVADKNIIPIYGGNDTSYNKSESENFGFKVPPRPQARRVETIRQQLRVAQAEQQAISRGFSTFHIQEALRRAVSNRVEVAVEQTTLQEVELQQIPTPERLEFWNAVGAASPIPAEVDTSRHRRFLQYSRLLSQEAASLSSLSTTLSSALNSVESMVDDLETIIHNHPITVNVAAEIPPMNNTLNSTVGTNFSESHSSAPSMVILSNPMMIVAGEEGLNLGSQTNPTVQRSTGLPASGVSTRRSRRRRLSDDVDDENGLTREPIRRRMR